MPTNEERLRILQMISESKITAQDGAHLLEAMRCADAQLEGKGPTTPIARWLHVRVTDITSAKTKTDITIPIHLVQIGIKLGARFVGDQHLSTYDDVINAIQTGHTGKLLEAEDNESGERVEIFVE